MYQPNLRTKNPYERQVIDELQADGYIVLKRGWPDFLAIRGDEVMCVEVKRPREEHKQGLAFMQGTVCSALARKGIKTVVAYGTMAKQGPAVIGERYK